MLRRPPTAIRLTQQDVHAYDDDLAKKKESQNNENKNPHVRPDPPQKTREERIGLKK